MTREFTIQEFEKVKLPMGGSTEEWTDLMRVQGILDMLTGTSLSGIQNAIVEESTHILIIPEYTQGIEEKMRVIDEDNRYYSITYSDNPAGQNHHNEVYLKYGGTL